MIYSMMNYIDKYTPQIFVLLLGSMFIVLAVLFYVWFYNRKKFHQFKHQIPSSVVKNYLDSIIQNSTALKSSLFRGGGLDVDPNSIPSVMPLDLLQGGTPVGVTGGSGGDEALHAEISKLKAELSEKANIITELEAKNTELEGVVKQKQERIEELEKLLAEAQANAGSSEGGEADPAALAEITKERDELKDALKQYEIIEDDLADLKRLRQENEQLKASLNGGAPTPTPAAEPVAAPEAAPEPAPVAEPEPAPVVAEQAPPVQEEAAPAAEPVQAAAETTPAEEDKSAEDLLSEFEKMLG